MKIRVLGCSGAIAKDCRTTSFLVDDDLLVDAGTGVGDLTLEEMSRVNHVLLTHSHLDHVAALPLMLDACTSLRSSPVQVHALPQTIAALQAHVFNNLIWPDFSAIPSIEHPFLRFTALAYGQRFVIGDRQIEVMPAVHTVPGCGYAISQDNKPAWVFTGDTEKNPLFWEKLNAMSVGMLVIETAFSDKESDLARKALHLAPATLADELDQIDPGQSYPIYITHTKPAETELIMAEIQRFDDTDVFVSGVKHDIRWLRAGDQFHL